MFQNEQLMAHRWYLRDLLDLSQGARWTRHFDCVSPKHVEEQPSQSVRMYLLAWSLTWSADHKRSMWESWPLARSYNFLHIPCSRWNIVVWRVDDRFLSPLIFIRFSVLISLVCLIGFMSFHITYVCDVYW